MARGTVENIARSPYVTESGNGRSRLASPVTSNVIRNDIEYRSIILKYYKSLSKIIYYYKI